MTADQENEYLPRNGILKNSRRKEGKRHEMNLIQKMHLRSAQLTLKAALWAILNILVQLLILLVLKALIIFNRKMSVTQFEREEQDELFLSLKIKGIEKKKRMCKFIANLNEKSFKGQDTEQSYTFQTMMSDCGKLPEEKNEVALLPLPSNTYDFDQNARLIEKIKNNSKPQGKSRKRNKRITIEKRGTMQPLNGQGVVKLANGDVVFAKWENGTVEGPAKVVYNSGNRYVGDVKDYQRCGSGIYFFKRNSYKYQGEFSDGLFDGKGVLIDDSGSIIKKGIWRNGCLIQTII